MPETTDYKIALNTLNSLTLYKAIKKLITNKKFRQELQFNGFKNVKHITKNNSHKIDQIREKLFVDFRINYSKNILRIINIII